MLFAPSLGIVATGLRAPGRPARTRNFTMTDAILVLCTCPDEASADLISEQLLNQRLAACINQVPGLTSVYRWQGKIERAREIQLIIKSRASLFELLRQCILSHHPYEVPEILALPTSQGHQPYLDWLTQETS
ncbi:divalent-cation tolerance protein CutA [Aeromonas bestiarum]|nr:divalent-cation tolerance protein CutA [Aeromonas sp. CA23]POG21769.1 divalent-cation tolerance protein CutA [Aeromonas bestiarum]